MNLRLKLILQIVFILLTIRFSNAQIKIHTTYSVEDGLVQSNINAMHQDRQGYLWFATLDGISRWDGIHFKNFYSGVDISEGQVYDIFEDDDGSLFFPTYGGGVYKFENGKMKQAFPGLAKIDNFMANMEKDDRGNYWFGHYTGTSRVDTAGKAKHIDSSYTVWPMHRGKNNTIYLGAYHEGLRVLRDGEWTTITKKEGLANNEIWSIYESADSNIYIGTNNGVYVAKNGRVINYLGNEFPALKSRTIAISGDRSGGLWFGTNQGVVFFNNGHYQLINSANGLPMDDVWSIFEDKCGYMYIGTGGSGFARFKPGLIETWNRQTGLPSNVVRSVCEDDAGRFYFATDNGVAILDKGNIRLLNISNGLAGNNVRKIISDETGRMLIGTHNGLTILEHGKMKTLTEKDGLISNNILSLALGKNNKVYICTARGLSILQNGNFRNYSKKDGMVDEYVTYAFEDTNGDAYIGTYIGVAVLRSTGDWDTLGTAQGLRGSKIDGIFRDSRGILYFATQGSGLNYQVQDTMRHLDMKSGLTSNAVWSIEEGIDEQIYLATTKGVNVVSGLPDHPSVRFLGYGDGFASDEHNRDAAFKDSQGRLWFGTPKGATCYNPQKDQRISSPPEMFLRSASLFGEPVALNKSRFDYDQNYLGFDFIGLFLPAPEKVVYAYRLVGLSERWIETRSRHIQFTNLSPGDYTLEIKAANEWGYWSEPLQQAFQIAPPFWKTWWFYSLVFVIALFVLWGIFRLRLNQLLRIERLRTKIASDLHDDVGSMLTRIFMNSELIAKAEDEQTIREKARSIGEISKDTARTFSDIIWAIEAGNDSVGAMTERMRDLVFQLLTEQEIETQFTINGLDESKMIGSHLRQNIFLIFKEAVNNIAKHASADQVWIELKNRDQHFIMTIKDNGTGFNGSGNGSGHGLRSMHRRAKKLRGSLTVSENGGIEVCLTMPAV